MIDRPKHLLILDDEKGIRRSITEYMEDDGYIGFPAETGEEALEIVKNNQIDEAVVDISLPGIDGNTFMVEARKILPEIKFVVHTGSADYVPPDDVKKLGVGSSNILIKPSIDLNVLTQALAEQY